MDFNVNIFFVAVAWENCSVSRKLYFHEKKTSEIVVLKENWRIFSFHGKVMFNSWGCPDNCLERKLPPPPRQLPHDDCSRQLSSRIIASEKIVPWMIPPLQIIALRTIFPKIITPWRFAARITALWKISCLYNCPSDNWFWGQLPPPPPPPPQENSSKG